VTLGQAIAPSGSSGAVQTLTTTGASGAASGDRTTAIQLAASGGGTVLANVSESDVSSLNAGQAVHIDFTGLPGQSTSGTIADVSGAATMTRDNNVAYPVHINIGQMPSAARIGMSVTVSVDTGNGDSGDQNVLVAPREALRTVDGQSVVSKVDSGQVVDVPVQVGRSFGSQVELVSGVAEGDILAIYSAPTAPPKASN
jgi:HlyD family secretion protein